MIDTADFPSCPNAERMGEHACMNRRQCWEPCGDLGKSAEHAVPVDMTKRFEPGGPITCLGGK